MQWRKIFFRVLQSDSMMFSWSGYNWGIFVLVGHLSTAPNLPGSFAHGYVVVASRWKHLSGSCCEHEQSDCKVKLGLNVREDRVRVRATFCFQGIKESISGLVPFSSSCLQTPCSANRLLFFLLFTVPSRHPANRIDAIL